MDKKRIIGGLAGIFFATAAVWQAHEVLSSDASTTAKIEGAGYALANTGLAGVGLLLAFGHSQNIANN